MIGKFKMSMLSLDAVSLWSRRTVALALVLFLVQAPQVVAQLSSVGAQAGAPRALHIVILDGDNALNNIRQRTAREPIVEVQDENHKPVAGASVLFTIHTGAAGAGGGFAGASTLAVITGLDGQAIAKGFQPNATQGTFNIAVTASVGTVTTSTVIVQTNLLGSLTSVKTQTKAGQTTSVAHHLALHVLTKNFLIVAGGVTAATAVAVTVAVINHNNGATITAGGGTVKP
jgi:hypothetical protein